jgi:hypothetical protein
LFATYEVVKEPAADPQALLITILKLSLPS